MPAPLEVHPEKMIDDLALLVDVAGNGIMNIYRQADLGIEIKVDQSPFTKADLKIVNYYS